ncbi:MAG: hypothetical protein RMH97_03425 [Verrucomicrobiales bacterium]|nr:hypothetical protein [Verrucomicrobiales bacterium]
MRLRFRLGSIMIRTLHGRIGVVTSASGARDTNEIVTEKAPLNFGQRDRTVPAMPQRIKSLNMPMAVSGLFVKLGDRIVFDSDRNWWCCATMHWLRLVPRENNAKVTERARRNIYKQLGLPEDASVKCVSLLATSGSYHFCADWWLRA